MQYFSSMLGMWFIFVGLAFIFISTKVNDRLNKFNFFGCGLIALIIGAFPMLMNGPSSTELSAE